MAELLTPRPASPAEGVHFVENFFGNGLITTNNVGQNDWAFTAIGNTGTFTYLTTVLDDDPPFGGIRHLTAGTADGDGDALHMLAATGVFPNSVKGGGFACRFNYPNISGNVIADNNFYIGVHTSVTAVAPTDGILVQSLGGVMTLRVDTADGTDKAVAFSGGSTLTSGTTAVKGVPHQLEVHWSGENGQGGPLTVEAFCDNIPVADTTTDIDNNEAATPSIVHWQDEGNVQTYELDIHWFEYWQFMDYPTAPAV